MRYILIVLFLGGCAQDKAAHFTVGAITSAIVTDLTDDPWTGCLAALGIGVAKELYDSQTHSPELADAIATGAGCSVNFVF